MRRKCEFSETQFEAYHSRQFDKLMGSVLPQYFPTRNEEGELGIDVMHFTKYQNYFLQYKVPYTISNTNKKCIGLSGNCFQIRIYNRRGRKAKSQYKLLWEWAKTEPNVWYVTPKFNLSKDFSTNYLNIIKFSAHYNIRNLKNPYTPNFDTHQHFLVYSTDQKYGKMFSDKYLKVSETDVQKLETASQRNQIEFSDYIIQIIQNLKELAASSSQFLWANDIIDKYQEKQLLNTDIQSSHWKNYYQAKYLLNNLLQLDWVTFFKK